MADVMRGTLTEKGLALLAKSHSGSLTMQFTKMTVGSGKITAGANLEVMTALVTDVYTCETITSAYESGNDAVILTAYVSTARVSAGFDLREIGVWAQDPDEGEILYAYANLGDYVTRIPATGGGQATIFELDVYIKVANSEDVVINVGGSVSQWTLIDYDFVHNFDDFPVETVFIEKTGGFGDGEYGGEGYGGNVTGQIEIQAISEYTNRNAQKIRINRRILGTPTITKETDNEWVVEYSDISLRVVLTNFIPYLKKSANLSDVVNADTARDNLKAAHVDHLHDTRYLLKSANLSDVANADTARDNLKAAHVDHTHDIEAVVRQMKLGTIEAFAGPVANIPTGTFLCDGSAKNRTTYAGLYAKIGTTWGVGNGTTTFNVPDLRKAFLRGAMSGTREVGTTEANQMAQHYHGTGRFAAITGSPADDWYGIRRAWADGQGYTAQGTDGQWQTLKLITLGSNSTASLVYATGTSNECLTGANETRPANKAVNYIIWAY